MPGSSTVNVQEMQASTGIDQPGSDPKKLEPLKDGDDAASTDVSKADVFSPLR